MFLQGVSGLDTELAVLLQGIMGIVIYLDMELAVLLQGAMGLDTELCNPAWINGSRYRASSVPAWINGSRYRAGSAPLERNGSIYRASSVHAGTMGLDTELAVFL